MGFDGHMAGLRTLPTITETLATEYVIPVDCFERYRATLVRMNINTSGTAQVVTIMSPQKTLKVSADALEAQPDVVVEDLTGVEALDHVAFRLPNGRYFFSTVLSVDTLTITLNDNLPTGGLKENAFGVSLGVPTDDGHIAKFSTGATGDNVYADEAYGLFSNTEIGYPMIIHITNATAQALWLGANVVYHGTPPG